MRDLGGHRWDLLLAVAQSLLQGKAGGGAAPRPSEGSLLSAASPGFGTQGKSTSTA